MKLQLETLIRILSDNEAVDKNITFLIINNFTNFISNKSRIVSYERIAYQKELLKQLLADGTLKSTQSLREAFYFLNYNNDNFITYECERLKQNIENLQSKTQKIIA